MWVKTCCKNYYFKLEIQVRPRKPVSYLAVNRQEISRILMAVRLNFSIINDVTELI